MFALYVKASLGKDHIQRICYSALPGLSHISPNRRESLPVAQMLGMYRVPIYLPILDLRKWVWATGATFTWWPEAESPRLALQEPVLTQEAGQAE